MIEVNLHTYAPLILLLDLKVNDYFIDLHNDFLCNKIEIADKVLNFYFEKSDFGYSSKYNSPKKMELKFIDFYVEKMNDLLKEKLPASLDNLSKTTMEPGQNNNRYTFIISLCGDEEYEINAKEIKLILE